MSIRLDYRNGILKLLEEYNNIIIKEIKEGAVWREKIEKNKLSEIDKQVLLKDICAQILLQGRSSKGVRTQLRKIDNIIEEWKIDNVKNNIDSIGMSRRKRKKLQKILNYLKNNSLDKWIIELHKGNDKIPHIGLKSDDDFLKSHGFFEHIPIDRHTQRFLFRTGIIYWYLKENNDDIMILLQGSYIQKYKLFQKIITKFCETYCSDIYISSPIGKLNLAKNKGIFDL